MKMNKACALIFGIRLITILEHTGKEIKESPVKNLSYNKRNFLLVTNIELFNLLWR